MTSRKNGGIFEIETKRGRILALDSKYCGRRIISTNRTLTGNAGVDALTVMQILNDVIAIHEANARDEDELFRIFFNDSTYWSKQKKQRNDINNKITVDDAWAVTRTVNSYCFGEPIKYVSRQTDDESGKQAQVETLSEFLDYMGNHNATIMATLASSVCGLGYKLALPSNKEELEFSGVPFVINNKFINPQSAFCVYSTSIVGEKVMGVLIGDHYDKNNNLDGKQYTVWTKYYKYVIISDTESEFGYKIVPFEFNGRLYEAEPNTIGRIPLVEIERNAFRKGDWEICKDLFKIKNTLISNRLDDVEQIIDYVLLLINCEFENDADKKNAINDRIFSLTQKDSKNQPKVDILKNPLDQTGVQVLCDYIDQLIETTAGIPSRAERSGGGHDTGKAVVYRNGFRDLENNAGMIIPKMDKAETEFLGICIAYSHNLTDGKDKLNALTPFDVRNKFVRSLSDDPITASTAYATFKNAGMNDLDAIINAKAATDPAEVHKNNLKAQAEIDKYLGKNNDNNKSKTTRDGGDDGDKNNEVNG